jgi:CHRD domain-containing protein
MREPEKRESEQKEVRTLKSRRLLAALVLAMLAALVLALPASAGGGRATLEANLTGEQEVPGPGDPNGRGEAEVKVFKAKVCYTLKVQRIKPATAAHIHVGRRGDAGPVVVPLNAPTDGFSKGCEEISRKLSRALREHPNRYYVNVHNRPYPEGAIRGQLHYDDA